MGLSWDTHAGSAAAVNFKVEHVHIILLLSPHTAAVPSYRGAWQIDNVLPTPARQRIPTDPIPHGDSDSVTGRLGNTVHMRPEALEQVLEARGPCDVVQRHAQCALARLEKRRHGQALQVSAPVSSTS